MDWSHKLFLESVRKKKVENMHKFYSYLPLWNSSFDVVVGLDFSIQVKLFFSGYVFNRVGMADQNQEKKI